MGDFAPDVTPRYIARYVSVGLQHDVMFRVPRDTTYSVGVAAAQLGLHDIFVELVTSLPTDFAWISARWYDQNSDDAIPAAVPAAVAGTHNTNLFSKADKISHLTFSGKGFAGSKVSMKVFGVAFDPDELPANPENKFAFDPGDYATIDAAVAALNSAALLTAIDNTHPIWYGRVNLKINDHYLKGVRRGIL